MYGVSQSARDLELSSWEFPDVDLMPVLVDKYFSDVNLILPLLHRPTFECYIIDGLHLRKDSFASVLLMVCALGARYTLDPRVRCEGDSTGASSGWKWFVQAKSVCKSIFEITSLEDIQSYAVSTALSEANVYR
jgi:hypothetical protein